MMSLFKKLILYFLVIVGFLFLCLFFFLSVYVFYYSTEKLRWPKEKFTEQKWKESDEIERYKLVKDLLDSHLLAGKTKEEVIAILGEPSSSYSDGFMYVLTTREDRNKLNLFPTLYILQINLDEDQNILEVLVRETD